jgi:hypothetical protein
MNAPNNVTMNTPSLITTASHGASRANRGASRGASHHADRDASRGASHHAACDASPHASRDASRANRRPMHWQMRNLRSSPQQQSQLQIFSFQCHFLRRPIRRPSHLQAKRSAPRVAPMP